MYSDAMRLSVSVLLSLGVDCAIAFACAPGVSQAVIPLPSQQDHSVASRKTPTAKPHSTSSKRQAENLDTNVQDIQIDFNPNEEGKQNEIEISQNGFPFQLKRRVLAEVGRGLKEAEVEMKRAGFSSKLSRTIASVAVQKALREASNSMSLNKLGDDSPEAPEPPDPPEAPDLSDTGAME